LIIQISTANGTDIPIINKWSTETTSCTLYIMHFHHVKYRLYNFKLLASFLFILIMFSRYNIKSKLLDKIFVSCCPWFGSIKDQSFKLHVHESIKWPGTNSELPYLITVYNNTSKIYTDHILLQCFHFPLHYIFKSGKILTLNEKIPVRIKMNKKINLSYFLWAR
jgi:hypothetical protein